MTGETCDVLVRAEDHRRIMEHLFPGDGDEHGAILRAGIVRSGSVAAASGAQTSNRPGSAPTMSRVDTATGRSRRPSFTARSCSAGTQASPT